MPFIDLEHKGKKYKSAYLKLGEGDEYVIVFHGFGQKKEDYKNIGDTFENKSVLVFELFDHGQSSRVYDWDEMLNLYQLLFDKVISKFAPKSVQIIGFSIGTRVASYLGSHNKNVGSVQLFAPDITPEVLFFRLFMKSPLRWLLYFNLWFKWPVQIFLYLAKAFIPNPFDFFYKLWVQKKYRRRLKNVWSGFRKVKNKINWEQLTPKLVVFILSKESILNNKKLKTGVINEGWFAKS